jgi:GntR family transcriptional regulator
MTSPTFVPRYVAIEQALRARIARLEPGEELPSDAELCEEFGVSRMTARNAVHQLKLEGLVRRVPGRGTFVAERSAHRQAGNLLSFSEEMRRRGLDARSAVVDHVVREAGGDEARRLALDGETAVVALTRVRLSDGAPVALEDAVLPGSVAPALEDVDFTRASLHESLVAAGHVPTAGSGTLEAQPAGPRDAKLLGVRRGAPLLVERRVINDQHGRPLELSETRYVADRYSLEVEFGVELAARPQEP